MKEIIGIVAAGLVFIAYAPYIRDTLSGKTKPHPYSWFVWSLLTFIIFSLQVTHGSGSGSYVTLTVAVLSFFIFIISLPGGTTQITKLDTIFFISALAAIGLWLFANRPTLSMVLLVSIDMLGFAPTIRKAYFKPNEETLFTWNINGLRHAISILAIQKYSLLTLLNPVAWTIANIGFSALLIGRRKATSK